MSDVVNKGKHLNTNVLMSYIIFISIILFMCVIYVLFCLFFYIYDNEQTKINKAIYEVKNTSSI